MPLRETSAKEIATLPPSGPGCLASRSRAAGRALRLRGLARRRRAFRRGTTTRRRMGLPRQRLRRCRAVSFALERFSHRPRPCRRRFRGPTTARERILRTSARLGGSLSLLRRRQLHAGATRLREADGDRLLGRPCAMLALANMVYLLAHELARLRGRCLALTRIRTPSLQRPFFPACFLPMGRPANKCRPRAPLPVSVRCPAG